MRKLLLFPLYFLLLTPIGLASRLTRDPLRRRWDSNAKTYWIYVREGS
ncbi:MAG: hypothetical protein ACRDT8_01925 [Micromonosporaceae bacterium]